MRGEAAYKRATFREPVALGIVGDPLSELLLLGQSQPEAAISNTLEDVVVVLGCPEHRRRRGRDVLNEELLL